MCRFVKKRTYDMRRHSVEKKLFSGAFWLFGIAGIIAYSNNANLSDLVLALAFIGFGTFLFVRYRFEVKRKM